MRSIPGLALLALIAMWICVCGSALASPPSGQSRLGAPPRLVPVPAPTPELEGAERARRAFQASFFGEAQSPACLGPRRCETGGGWGLGASALWRTGPHFSWGPLAHYARRSHHAPDGLAGPIGVRDEALALMLTGRLGLLPRGDWDPHVQFATGLGAEWRTSSATGAPRSLGATEHVAQQWVPVYSVTFGLDLHVTEHFRAGPHVAWTHWLRQPWERCPVVTGVCTQPGPWGFDPQSGVLSLGFGVQLNLGARR